MASRLNYDRAKELVLPIEAWVGKVAKAGHPWGFVCWR